MSQFMHLQSVAGERKFERVRTIRIMEFSWREMGSQDRSLCIETKCPQTAVSGIQRTTSSGRLPRAGVNQSMLRYTLRPLVADDRKIEPSWKIKKPANLSQKTRNQDRNMCKKARCLRIITVLKTRQAQFLWPTVVRIPNLTARNHFHGPDKL